MFRLILDSWDRRKLIPARAPKGHSRRGGHLVTQPRISDLAEIRQLSAPIHRLAHRRAYARSRETIREVRPLSNFFTRATR
jgi:hypothetical protein